MGRSDDEVESRGGVPDLGSSGSTGRCMQGGDLLSRTSRFHVSTASTQSTRSDTSNQHKRDVERMRSPLDSDGYLTVLREGPRRLCGKRG